MVRKGSDSPLRAVKAWPKAGLLLFWQVPAATIEWLFAEIQSVVNSRSRIAGVFRWEISGIGPVSGLY